MKDENIHKFYSSGKLLITGEYLVLQGATSLAVPTKAGQFLYVQKGGPNDLLNWSTTVLSKSWFHCSIDPVALEVLETDKPEIAVKLASILKAACEVKGNSDWLRGVTAASEVGFDIEWGLGSSSSLISNISWWADIDPFILSRRVSQGSGYDIACARSDGPILYKSESTATEISNVEFNPSFADNIAFVYLGRKQNSAESVKKFLDHAIVREKDIIRISDISKQVVLAGTLEEYEQLLSDHERILSGVLDKPQVKEALFRDYPGMVKSLGAWGGDFIHISLRPDLDVAREYFNNKGLKVLIPYKEMVKNQVQ